MSNKDIIIFCYISLAVKRSKQGYISRLRGRKSHKKDKIEATNRQTRYQNHVQTHRCHIIVLFVANILLLISHMSIEWEPLKNSYMMT